MKRFILIFTLAVIAASAHGQKVAVKTNLLYDATATINLGLEFGLGRAVTLDVSGNYNPWSFGDKEWKHWLAQPELRWWTCEKFQGHFFGLHGHYGEYSVGGFGFLPIPGYINDKGFIGGTAYEDNLKNRRYEGSLWGAGISWGYQWILGDRWNLETTIGGGFAVLDFHSWPIAECGVKSEQKKYTYWGLTKVGVTFLYFFN